MLGAMGMMAGVGGPPPSGWNSLDTGASLAVSDNNRS
jgi:hypothetical protein